MAETIRISRRFCGPPDSGNGGYVAGIIARTLGGSNVSVTLRHPPPLDRNLELATDGAEAWLKDDETVIASAVRNELSIEVPPPPDLGEAEEATRRYVGFRHHAFPGCFVCGPERASGDGLGIYPGTRENGRVAAVWNPHQSLFDASGALASEFIWAALDCPGYWSVSAAAGKAVLGRFTAAIHTDLISSQPLIVTGWPLRSEGRKHEAGTAIHDTAGQLLAAAQATWITLRE